MLQGLEAAKSSVEDKYCESTYRPPRRGNFTDPGSRLEDTRGGRVWGMGRVVSNKYRASVGGHENILETDSGVGCTRL